MAGRRVRPPGAEAANCNRGAELKEQFAEEEADAAELPALEELKLDSPDHPTKPLFSGEWE